MLLQQAGAQTGKMTAARHGSQQDAPGPYQQLCQICSQEPGQSSKAQQQPVTILPCAPSQAFNAAAGAEQTQPSSQSPHHSSIYISDPECPGSLSVGSMPQANTELQPSAASQQGAGGDAAAASVRTEMDRAALVQEHGDVLKGLLANLASRKKVVKAVLHMLHVR